VEVARGVCGRVADDEHVLRGGGTSMGADRTQRNQRDERQEHIAKTCGGRHWYSSLDRPPCGLVPRNAVRWPITSSPITSSPITCDRQCLASRKRRDRRQRACDRPAARPASAA